MDKVLLLNASYEPLNICSWRRALILIIKGKADEIEHNGCLINNSIPAPLVIKLRYYVAVPYTELPFNKKNVLHRDNHTCQYCGKKDKNLSADHVIPKSKGGESSWENVVAACFLCNNKKANKTPQEAGMKLLKSPEKPSNYIKFELTKQSEDILEYWQKYIAG